MAEKLLKVGECKLGQVVRASDRYGKQEFYKIVGFTKSNAPKLMQMRTYIVEKKNRTENVLPIMHMPLCDTIYISRVFQQRRIKRFRPYSDNDLAKLDKSLRVRGMQLYVWNGHPALVFKEQ